MSSKIPRLTDEEYQLEASNLHEVHLRCIQALEGSFKLPHLSAVALGVSTFAGMVGPGVQIHLPNGDQMPPTSSFLSPNDTPFHHSFHAARWITKIMRKRARDADLYRRNLDPDLRAKLWDDANQKVAEDAIKFCKLRETKQETLSRILFDQHHGKPADSRVQAREMAEREQRERDGDFAERQCEIARQHVELSGIAYQSVQLLYRPLFFLNQLPVEAPELCKTLSFDGQVHMIGKGIDSIESLLTAPPLQRERLLKFLGPAIAQEEEVPMMNSASVHHPNLNLLLSLSSQEIGILLRNPELEKAGLWKHCLLLQPPNDAQPALKLDEEAKRHFHAYGNRIWECRIQQENFVITIDDKAWALYGHLEREFHAKAGTGLAPFDQIQYATPKHALKLSACICFPRDQVLTEKDLLLALYLVEQLNGQARSVLTYALLTSVSPPVDPEAAYTMAGKLRRKGPCTRRDLYRSYSKQSKDLHEPVLELAMDLGLIQEVEGVLSIVEPISVSAAAPQASAVADSAENPELEESA